MDGEVPQVRRRGDRPQPVPPAPAEQTHGRREGAVLRKSKGSDPDPRLGAVAPQTGAACAFGSRLLRSRIPRRCRTYSY